MRLHKTGHPIADTVSDLIGELPDGDYSVVYGILRHNKFSEGKWFECDKGFYGAKHFDGNYRISFMGTQPLYSPDYPISEAHGLTLEPWRKQSGYALICPPTEHVCKFFKIDYTTWLMNAVRQEDNYRIRNKGCEDPIEWDGISKLVTFNSTLGVQALIKGIPVVSNQLCSTIGSFCRHINSIDGYDRNKVLRFMSGHQFKLGDKDKIKRLIEHYLNEPT